MRVGVVAEDGTWSGSVTTRRLLKDGAVTMRVDAAAAGRVWFVEAHPREEVRSTTRREIGGKGGANVLYRLRRRLQL